LANVRPTLAVLIGIAFAIALGVIDHATGPGATFAPFYLIPVTIVTWNAGRTWGLAIAGLSTLATQIADVRGYDGNGLVPSWNSIVWFAGLMFVVGLVTALRRAVARQGRALAAEEELAHDLRQQNDDKDTLLHAVSHDLKGPLAGIIGAMQTIRRADQLRLSDAEMDDLYGVIEQAGAKASRLVDDLLDLDRLGRGQLTPERGPTDVVGIARRLTAEVSSLAGHPVRVEGDRALVDVDGGKVERIVENLLGNAGRHTPPGTPIHVDVQSRPNGVIVLVEDEGPGVPDGLKDPIFEPFQQGANSRGGVGIGLSLVRRFAELHGGTAHVEDRPGGGARFVVVLPGAVTEAPPAAGALRAV
jgi:two-component system, OmpR family, sensor histidine kinase KdpD